MAAELPKMEWSIVRKTMLPCERVLKYYVDFLGKPVIQLILKKCVQTLPICTQPRGQTELDTSHRCKGVEGGRGGRAVQSFASQCGHGGDESGIWENTDRRHKLSDESMTKGRCTKTKGINVWGSEEIKLTFTGQKKMDKSKSSGEWGPHSRGIPTDWIRAWNRRLKKGLKRKFLIPYELWPQLGVGERG